MRRFLLRLMIFFLPVAILFIAGEYAVRSLDNPYKSKAAFIEKHGKEIETLFLGDSHVYYGLRADLWPGLALNAGDISQPLAYDYYFLEHYIDSMPALKRVILRVSCTSLFDDALENTGGDFLVTSYRLYMGIGPHSRFSRYGFEFMHPQNFLHKLKEWGGWDQPMTVCDSLGNGLTYTLEKRKIDWKETGPAMAAGHISEAHPERVPVNMDYLRQIRRLCQSRDIELILYSQPEWETYLENMNPDQLRTMRDSVRAFCAEGDARHYDFIDDPRFTEEDFFDADHLNREKGAPKLTRILADTILHRLPEN